jgi:saccharopine dehydrogenase-like NADP-dependent oxidoreductase
MGSNRNGRTVAILGGGGGMGRHAAVATTTLAGVERVLVADREISAAARVASACGSCAEALELDITDETALRATLREADVVLNAVGPYFRFGPPVLEAAIGAGCDYLDLCDDPEPTVAMLEMSAEAERVGIRAVIGMGASPGIVNLLAVVAMRELDEVHSVVSGWNGEGASPEPGSGPAAIEHGIAQATGTIPVVSEGRERAERPLRRVAVDYPGLGRCRARTFGHPEPVTLHRTFDVAESVNVTHGRLRFIAPLMALAWLCDRRLLSTRRAVRVVDWAERRMPSPSLGALASSKRLPPLFALAEGERGGAPAGVGVALTALPGQNMGAVTGVPLAVAAGLLLSGAQVPPGAHPPESAFDPREFFDALAPYCPGTATGQSALLVTRSWNPDASVTYRAGIEAARQRFHACH